MLTNRLPCTSSPSHLHSAAKRRRPTPCRLMELKSVFLRLTAFSMAMWSCCTTVLLTADLSALSWDVPGGPPGVVDGAIDHA